MNITKQLMRWVLGEKLSNTQLTDQKFNVFWGAPILASDAISSVAYAVDEMLWILVPAIGMASYLWLPKVAGAIVILLMVLIFSYRQTVEAYPNGGGAYVVARTNLGPTYGLIAGASLIVDYTLTVAVSVSSGVAAIVSVFPSIYLYKIYLCVLVIALMVIGNLRGVKDASRWFSIPTYAFIFSCLAIIGVGLFKYFTGTYVAPTHLVASSVKLGEQSVTLFLILRAFSSGCAAVTGVEAISNAVPNFAEPSTRSAKKAYLLLGLAVFITFFGMAVVAMLYHAMPNTYQTVTAQIAIDLFGRGGMFYFIQATTMVILAMAANTAFAGFPILLSLIASDGYAPRQLALRGHRLSFSNGIITLAIMASCLVVIFKGDTHLLIPLYAVGVFTSFTLSQTGMVRHWLKTRGEGWHYKIMINGLGAIVTLITVTIIAVTKFPEGAWIVVIVVPAMVYLMMRVKKHYQSLARQLDVPNDVLLQISVEPDYKHHVIIPIDSLNVMVIKALRYAKSLSNNVEAFHVEPREGEADKLRAKWEMLSTDIPLIIKPSPYREVIRPLLNYINSEEHASKQRDMITVLLPQFVVNKWWQMMLHNNTSLFIANALFHKRNLVVSVLPFYLEDVSIQRRKQQITGDRGTTLNIS